jgi:anti-anti-sigma factor
VAAGCPGIEYRVVGRSGDGVVVQLVGELTGAGHAARLREALEEQFVDDGVRVITIDASTITFVDNHGVAALLELRRESERKGKRLLVQGSDRQVRDKLRVTGVLNLLEGGDPIQRGGS